LRLTTPGGARLLATVTHLHHLTPDAAIRDRQAQALLAWLEAAPATDAQVVVGDFNAPPDEPAYARMAAAGFRSAFREANGTEPGVTWPTGLIREVPEDDPPRCLDYVWLRGAITAPACRQVFDRPDADDPTLYPTDHVGLAASLEVGG
jgi:endonuclease/exonuclease/phosphatase family metal-dependent hydrolase